jgi:hypothetical protein
MHHCREAASIPYPFLVLAVMEVLVLPVCVVELVLQYGFHHADTRLFLGVALLAFLIANAAALWAKWALGKEDK